MPQFELVGFSTIILITGVSFCIYYCYVIGDFMEPINTSLGIRETFIRWLKRIPKRLFFLDDTVKYYQPEYCRKHYNLEFSSDKYYKKKTIKDK
jgi:hypothetical protein